MENLRDFSVIWSLVHILLIFMLLSRSRYSLRVTVSLTLCFMGCLILANAFLLKAIKIDSMGYLSSPAQCRRCCFIIGFHTTAAGNFVLPSVWQTPAPCGCALPPICSIFCFMASFTFYLLRG